MKESEHAKLICPVMTEFTAKAANGTPHCLTRACAMWRWTGGLDQVITVHPDQGKIMRKAGWEFLMNDPFGGLQYKKPYPEGERPGTCGIAWRENT